MLIKLKSDKSLFSQQSHPLIEGWYVNLLIGIKKWTQGQFSVELVDLVEKCFDLVFWLVLVQ